MLQLKPLLMVLMHGNAAVELSMLITGATSSTGATGLLVLLLELQLLLLLPLGLILLLLLPLMLLRPLLVLLQVLFLTLNQFHLMFDGSWWYSSFFCYCIVIEGTKTTYDTATTANTFTCAITVAGEVSHKRHTKRVYSNIIMACHP